MEVKVQSKGAAIEDPSFLAEDAMKSIPAKDEMEIKSVALFKSEWELNGYSRRVGFGADKMPRQAYALTVAAVIENLVIELDQKHMPVVVAVLSTVLGNASQLGAKLLKEKWLTEGSATDAVEERIKAMQARFAPKAS